MISTSLSELFNTLNPKHNNIISLLRRYNGKDWEKYVNINTKNNCINRNVIYSNNIFDMVIITWGYNYITGQHFHNDINKCYYKCLEGNLKETIICNNISDDKTKILHKIVYPNNVNSISNLVGSHSISNISNGISSSLHIYSKKINPYIECNINYKYSNLWILNQMI